MPPSPRLAWNRRRAAQYAAALLLFSALLISCTCPHQDRLQAIQRAQAELLSTSPGDTPHLLITVSFDALNEIAEQVIETQALSFRHREQVDLGLGSFSALIEGKVLDLKLAPSKKCKSCLAATVELSSTFQVTGGFATQGDLSSSLQLDLPLHLKRRDGATFLSLDLEGAKDVALGSLRGSYPDLLQDTLEGALTEVLSELPPLELFTIEPFALGESGLKIAPTSYRVSDSGLSMALAFNLPAPQGSLPKHQGSAPFQASIHTSTLLAMAQAMAATEKVPSQYNGDGAPDDEGAYHLSLDGLSISQRHFQLKFRLWRTSFPCVEASLQAEGNVEKNDDERTVILLTKLEMVDTDRFESALESVLWLRAEMVTAVADLSERFLNDSPIQFPGGALLLTPELVSSSGEVLNVSSKLSFHASKR